MKNKQTTELIDLLKKLVDKDGKLLDGYEEALEELENREPFFTLLNEDFDQSLPALIERISKIEEEIEKLKEHKHYEKTGDVMTKI